MDCLLHPLKLGTLCNPWGFQLLRLQSPPKEMQAAEETILTSWMSINLWNLLLMNPCFLLSHRTTLCLCL